MREMRSPPLWGACAALEGLVKLRAAPLLINTKFPALLTELLSDKKLSLGPAGLPLNPL